MVNMMRKEYIERLSPEGRVKNSYEAMYYRVHSNDPETDEIVHEQLRKSFYDNDLALSDNPNDVQLDHVVRHAYRESVRHLQKSELTPQQLQTIDEQFDSLKANHREFFDTIFDTFERRHDGMPVDFDVDYRRYREAYPLQEPTEEELEEMKEEFNERNQKRSWEDIMKDIEAIPWDNVHSSSQQKVYEGRTRTKSGLSYAGHAPEVKAVTTKRTFAQVKKEEQAANDMKQQHGRHDKQYEDYVRNQGGYQKFTAGDDYGFDERDYEDDGPEL